MRSMCFWPQQRELSDNWTAINNTSCVLGSFCKIQKAGGADKFDLSIGFFDAGEVYIQVLPHFNTPPEIGELYTAVERGQALQIDLSSGANDPDNDALHYEVDNSTISREAPCSIPCFTNGGGVIETFDSQTGSVLYMAPNSAGQDNFTFRVTDNISLNPSRWATVSIDVITPLTLDNFSAEVDNGSTILTVGSLP